VNTKAYEIPRILPELDGDNTPYWEAATRGELHLLRCEDCGRIVHPPRPGCAACAGSNQKWINLGGTVTGTVYTYVVVYKAFLPGYAQIVPYVIAVCDVDGAPGARVMANILNVAIEDVKIGMPVEMTWEKRSESITVPQWIPRRPAAPNERGK
jgi:uncharacterized protein